MYQAFVLFSSVILFVLICYYFYTLYHKPDPDDPDYEPDDFNCCYFKKNIDEEKIINNEKFE